MQNDQSDEAIYTTAIATAGAMQAFVAALGGFDRVREHDLVSAWRTSRAAQPGTGLVVCELPSKLPARRGAWDVAVLDPGRARAVEIAEMKWARENKLYELLWDAVKIATAIAGELDAHSTIGRGLLVAAAPSFEDLGPELQPLVQTGEWGSGSIVLDRPKIWSWACGSSRPPLEIPAGIALRLAASVPILAPARRADPWELRVLEVTVTEPRPVSIAT